MTYRDATEAMAEYESSIRAAREQYRKHEETSAHLFDGELKAMHKRLFRQFKAQAEHALAYLNSLPAREDEKEAA